jgi:hypothetical protein
VRRGGARARSVPLCKNVGLGVVCRSGPPDGVDQEVPICTFRCRPRPSGIGNAGRYCSAARRRGRPASRPPRSNRLAGARRFRPSDESGTLEDMGVRGTGGLSGWLERRDRGNQTMWNAVTPPRIPKTPSIVLEAITSVPDPAFAYRLRLRIDGVPAEGVPWGWSVHPLQPGRHVIELHHRSGIIPRASAAKAIIELDKENPVVHLRYKAGIFGIFGGRVAIGPYIVRG